jgi:hypothetical protein
MIQVSWYLLYRVTGALNRYISYLSLAGFSVSTITTYISAVSYVHKIRHITDTTKCFILTKMMEGLKREGNSSDLRSPITISLLCRLVSILLNVCSSDYEASMFSAAFTLALLVFCGLGNLLLIHTKMNPIGHYRLKIFGFLQLHQEFK